MKWASLQPPSRSQKQYRAFKGAWTGAMGLPVLVFAMLLFAPPASAQTNSMADRLPADTWAYFSWGGTSSLKSVSGTNSVLRLWKDPSFYTALENSFATVSHAGGPPQKFGGLTPAETAQIFSALENPAVVGFLSAPENAREKNHSGASFFLIYDATGKQELIDTLRRERDAKLTEPVERSSFPIGSVTVEKRVSDGNASYEAQAGPYYIVTESAQAMEELVPRFEAEHAPTVSFSQAADFPAECQELARPSLLNLVVLPARLQLPQPSGSESFDAPAFGRSLHLDRIRAGCMSMSFEKEVTRTRGVVLGDTSQGSILNVFGEGRDSFTTLALAPASASFQVSVIDFAALYNCLFTAVTAALPSDKAPFVAAGVAFLSSTWGMPPDQFFALFTGEVATIHPDNGIDPSDGLYVFTIHDPDKVLHVLQHAIPGEHVSTNQEGDVTYLTARIRVRPAEANSAADSATYFAVTPALLLASKQEGALRDAVARVHAGGSAQSNALTADADFQKARASLPAKLVSLWYANYAHFNWQKLFADVNTNLNNQAQQAARNANKPAPPRIQILPGLDPAVLYRYLHVSIGGAWKDSTGIYFDSYIQ